MTSWVARRWFLALLLLGFAAAALWPDLLRPIAERLPLRFVVALSLLLSSWGLEAGQLGRALTRPLGVALGLGVSFAVLPLTALALGPLLPMTDLRVGLLVMLCVPCTLSSAVLWTRQAGGDDALALLIVVATNLLAWLVTPLWLGVAGPMAVTVDAEAMMRSLALVLVLPVALGQALRQVPGVPGFVERHRAANGVVNRLLIALVLLAAATEAASQARAISFGLAAWTLLVCVVAHATGLLVAFGVGSLAGLGPAQRVAVAFAGSQKTLPVGLYLFNAYFRDDYPLAVVPMLLYHAAQLLLDTVIADRLHSVTKTADTPSALNRKARSE